MDNFFIGSKMSLVSTRLQVPKRNFDRKAGIYLLSLFVHIDGQRVSNKENGHLTPAHQVKHKTQA